jgi:hypothetical protein
MNHSFETEQPPDPPRPPDAKRRKLCSVGALALMLGACGGSDYSPPPPMAAPVPTPPPPPPAPTPAPTPAPPGPLTCGAISISANHGHVLMIPATDLDSMVSLAYDITGTADHAHTVVLTPAQLQQIKAKTAVLVNSSSNIAHFHEVTVNCA